MLLPILLGDITAQSKVAQSPTPLVVRYHFGDDAAWANPNFDDSAWPVAPDGKWPMPALNSDGFPLGSHPHCCISVGMRCAARATPLS
jgi:hypothetical protein